MNTTYKVLESDKDFFTAAMAQSKVSVWYREDPDPIGHLKDYGGFLRMRTNVYIMKEQN